MQQTPTATSHILTLEDLRTHFTVRSGTVEAVAGVSFSVPRRKTVCVVGESGCGKSVTALSILQVVPPPGEVVGGRILYTRRDGSITDIAGLKKDDPSIRALRGGEISMVFQEPMSSLSPVHTIGRQIQESVRLHVNLDRASAKERSIEALRRVGVPRPEQRIDSYTFELSGGLRQRAMIAMALACEPQLLIADEPTTALDVTTQATILDLFLDLQDSYDMSLVFITHDLGVVGEIADRVVVMYLGTVVEQGSAEDVFHSPAHPYTQSLLGAIPLFGETNRGRLATIPGSVPAGTNRPTGCPFHPRCSRFEPGVCDVQQPPVVSVAPSHESRCYFAEDVASGKVPNG